MRVDVNLQGKAKDLILEEQSIRVKRGKPMGKERLINLLLTELYDLRIKDKIIPPPAMNKKQWKKFIDTK